MRLAATGLVDGFEAEMIVAGINHGSNLGDDITYSGTVAAALEGILLGLPAIAFSQQSAAREMDFRLGEEFTSARARGSSRASWRSSSDVPLPEGTLLNVNAPAGTPTGVEVARLGKRIFRDELKLVDQEGDARRRYWMYGAVTGYHEEAGTDLAAIAAGHIAVTPLHFDLLDVEGMDKLARRDLARLLAPAAEEVE